MDVQLHAPNTESGGGCTRMCLEYIMVWRLLRLSPETLTLTLLFVFSSCQFNLCFICANPPSFLPFSP